MARIANAHAAATREPSPRPRNATAVSSPASAATLERRAQKQTLTGYPSSTTATMGIRSGISPAFQPEKWWSSNWISSIRTVRRGCTIFSGNVNAGPESTPPLTSDLYCSACTGSCRRSETGGSSRARPLSSKLVGDLPRYVFSHSPSATRRSSNEHEQRTRTWLRRTCCADTTFAIKQEQGL